MWIGRSLPFYLHTPKATYLIVTVAESLGMHKDAKADAKSALRSLFDGPPKMPECPFAGPPIFASLRPASHSHTAPSASAMSISSDYGARSIQGYVDSDDAALSMTLEELMEDDSKARFFRHAAQGKFQRK